MHKEGLFTQSLREGLNPSNYPDGIADSHKLAKFIQEQMAQTAQAPQYLNSTNPILLTKTLNKCPYRSLSYFTEKQEDAEVFYGRRKLTQDLVKRVRDKERLIAVFGASGSGKSSLIRAGLLYQLKSGQEIAGSNNWVYFDPFTPTDEPLARLQHILPDWILNEQRSGSILLPTSKLLESGNPALESGNTSERDARTPKENPTIEEKREDSQKKDQITPIILIIDQFEECFT